MMAGNVRRFYRCGLQRRLVTVAVYECLQYVKQLHRAWVFEQMTNTVGAGQAEAQSKRFFVVTGQRMTGGELSKFVVHESPSFIKRGSQIFENNQFWQRIGLQYVWQMAINLWLE